MDKFNPAQRVVSKPHDVNHSGLGAHSRASVMKEDPVAAFNKQPKRWLHVDHNGRISYVTVSTHGRALTTQGRALAAAVARLVLEGLFVQGMYRKSS